MTLMTGFVIHGWEPLQSKNAPWTATINHLPVQIESALMMIEALQVPIGSPSCPVTLGTTLMIICFGLHMDGGNIVECMTVLVFSICGLLLDTSVISYIRVMFFYNQWSGYLVMLWIWLVFWTSSCYNGLFGIHR